MDRAGRVAQREARAWPGPRGRDADQYLPVASPHQLTATGRPPEAAGGVLWQAEPPPTRTGSAVPTRDRAVAGEQVGRATPGQTMTVHLTLRRKQRQMSVETVSRYALQSVGNACIISRDSHEVTDVGLNGSQKSPGKSRFLGSSSFMQTPRASQGDAARALADDLRTQIDDLRTRLGRPRCTWSTSRSPARPSPASPTD